MFRDVLEQLRRHEDLTSAQATAVMHLVMDGAAQPAQIGGLLMALALKGERPAEMVGFARAMRERATPFTRVGRGPAAGKEDDPVADRGEELFDTCGTGGDGADTFNVSTAAALVIAGAGVKVAKHGNRAASSRCGSADVFEALGVKPDAGGDLVARALDQAGLAFFFAPMWHPSMRYAGPTRRELGVRTAFNLLGPLTNPAGAKRQVVGVSRPEQTELMARTLGMLGTERAWVVHGAGGLDELSTLGHTKVSELRNGVVNTFYVHPADVGLACIPSAEQVRGGDATENAALIEGLLAGRAGPRRDIVLLNAGAALLVAGQVQTLREGIGAAAASIDSGRASAVLATLRHVCGT